MRYLKPILFVNHSLATGGIETMITDLVRMLPSDDYLPSVAVFSGGGSLERVLLNRGIEIHRMNKLDGFDWRLVLRLRQVMREKKIEVVHSHNFSAWLYCTMAVRSLGGIRHIHTEHSGVDATCRRYFVERLLSRVTDHVVAVSSHVHHVLLNEIGISSLRATRIDNGVNTVRFSPDNAVRCHGRAELGFSSDDFVVGVVARLAPVKNHDLLFKAFSKLAPSLSKHKKLLVVGDGLERARLETLADALGIASATQFLGDRRDTEVLLNAMDAYVLPSLSEGMNLTLLEAMSTGLPVIATRVGGNIEIVQHEISGFLVSLEDPDEMALRLSQLATNSGLRQKLGSAARALAVERFNEQDMVKKYSALYSGKEG